MCPVLPPARRGGVVAGWLAFSPPQSPSPAAEVSTPWTERARRLPVAARGNTSLFSLLVDRVRASLPPVLPPPVNGALSCAWRCSLLLLLLLPFGLFFATPPRASTKWSGGWCRRRPCEGDGGGPRGGRTGWQAATPDAGRPLPRLASVASSPPGRWHRPHRGLLVEARRWCGRDPGVVSRKPVAAAAARPTCRTERVWPRRLALVPPGRAYREAERARRWTAGGGGLGRPRGGIDAGRRRASDSAIAAWSDLSLHARLPAGPSRASGEPVRTESRKSLCTKRNGGP